MVDTDRIKIDKIRKKLPMLVYVIPQTESMDFFVPLFVKNVIVNYVAYHYGGWDLFRKSVVPEGMPELKFGNIVFSNPREVAVVLVGRVYERSGAVEINGGGRVVEVVTDAEDGFVPRGENIDRDIFKVDIQEASRAYLEKGVAGLYKLSPLLGRHAEVAEMIVAEALRETLGGCKMETEVVVRSGERLYKVLLYGKKDGRRAEAPHTLLNHLYGGYGGVIYALDEIGSMRVDGRALVDLMYLKRGAARRWVSAYRSIRPLIVSWNEFIEKLDELRFE